jgi:hypothetical protein
MTATGNFRKYEEFDPFLDCDRDVKIEGRTVKVVKTRKDHLCMTPTLRPHNIPSGSNARVESAIVDGEFGRFYTCLECLEYLMKKPRWPPPDRQIWK